MKRNMGLESSMEISRRNLEADRRPLNMLLAGALLRFSVLFFIPRTQVLSVIASSRWGQDHQFPITFLNESFDELVRGVLLEVSQTRGSRSIEQ